MPGRLGIGVVLCLTIVGCGGGSRTESVGPPTLAQGSRTAACNGAMVGTSGPVDQSLATSVGRFVVWGTGRDFRTAQKAPRAGFSGLQERHIQGPILVTKTPFVVEGNAPLTVSITPRDRPRAGLVAGIPFGGGPWAEVRFVPCRDRPRTSWPGGWVLRDKGRVTVDVRPDNGPESQLVVGRP